MLVGIENLLTGSADAIFAKLISPWNLGRAIGKCYFLFYFSLLLCPPPFSGGGPAFSPCGPGRQRTERPWSSAIGKGWVSDQGGQPHPLC